MLNSGPEPGACANALGTPDSPPICNLYDLSFGDEAEDLPIITLRINLHLIGFTDDDDVYYNYTPDGAGDLNGQYTMSETVRIANEVLSDIIIDPMHTDNGIFGRDFIGDSRMRVELYTEASNTDDQYGGIWYHQSQDDYDSFQAPYDGLVTPVLVRASAEGCGSSGAALCNSGTIHFDDWYPSDADPNCTTWGFWLWGRTLAHELLHRAGLCHTFATENECYSPNDPTGIFADVDPYFCLLYTSPSPRDS